MKAYRYLPIAAVAVTGLFSGCAVGPDFKRPAAPAIDGYTREPLPAKTASADVTGGEEQRFVRDQEISAQWWTLFRSPQLNALIEKALKNNPSVQAAQASLRQAQELVYAQQGYYYPSVQASVSSSRQRAPSRPR
jgi:outer membrane protein TolC